MKVVGNLSLETLAVPVVWHKREKCTTDQVQLFINSLIILGIVPCTQYIISNCLMNIRQMAAGLKMVVHGTRLAIAGVLSVMAG